MFMRLRSNTGAGQPVALIMTRMATALAKIRPRRVLSEARKRERWTRKSRSRRPPSSVRLLVHFLFLFFLAFPHWMPGVI